MGSNKRKQTLECWLQILKFTLELTMKAQRRSRGTALLFLQPRREMEIGVSATSRPFYPQERDPLLTVRYLLGHTKLQVRYCTFQCARQHEAGTECTNSHMCHKLRGTRGCEQVSCSCCDPAYVQRILSTLLRSPPISIALTHLTICNLLERIGTEYVTRYAKFRGFMWEEL
jgi:hypothetical protein